MSIAPTEETIGTFEGWTAEQSLPRLVSGSLSQLQAHISDWGFLFSAHRKFTDVREVEVTGCVTLKSLVEEKQKDWSILCFILWTCMFHFQSCSENATWCCFYSFPWIWEKRQPGRLNKLAKVIIAFKRWALHKGQSDYEGTSFSPNLITFISEASALHTGTWKMLPRRGCFSLRKEPWMPYSP